MEIKDVRKFLGISNTDISEMFGYASKKAYENSTAKKRIERGIVRLYLKFKET